MPAPFEMEVEDLDRIRTSGGDPLVLDVREPGEVAICALPDSLHIPMGALPARVGELPRDRDIVVVCHHGGRSAQVTMWLRSQGFSRATNLNGGVDAWARRIDPNMKVY
ncbi:MULTISPECIES: rhodanese-like domain-containing protein [Azospirillum]|uniref:Sulfurtransferase n=2 Tax=Azospirillum TaxID=191 RepID=A0A4D8QW79_AZOBR|nr:MULTISPECIES: rhodanese-like domain-containing protein [Azospirillum]MDQ2102592.1 rhodanese-like domain-containing protein [Azospirillum isscasi]QCO13851.1 sulfurtransferase [Azospirillum brasilense]